MYSILRRTSITSARTVFFRVEGAIPRNINGRYTKGAPLCPWNGRIQDSGGQTVDVRDVFQDRHCNRHDNILSERHSEREREKETQKML